MAIFNSYVKLPEGIPRKLAGPTLVPPVTGPVGSGISARPSSRKMVTESSVDMSRPWQARQVMRSKLDV